MKPTIGRVVIYNTTAEEQYGMRALGNNIQEKLPAIIVAVWGDSDDACINAKVLIDGIHPDLWKTSINRGDEPGQWNWPVVQK